MKIGINALYLLPGKVGGTEIYIRQLAEWLVKNNSNNENEYLIFINKESVGVFDKLVPGIKIIVCPFMAASRPARILWEQLILPFQVWRRHIDILLSAGMTAPFYCPATSVVVIHDLQHVNQPKNFPTITLFFLKTIIYLSSRSADGIIAISQKVKNDIVKFYKVSPGKIDVIYHAADTALFFPVEKDDLLSARKKYHLPERFILYIASSLPHKNHERLFVAFKIIKERIKGIKLVLIGARDKGFDAVSEMINRLGLQDDVVFLGWLPFEDIPLIYCASEVFVFPSLHEGFGIPVLEAMSCGVPVVCSDIEPLTEIAGEAALFFDPYNPDNIAEVVLSVLKNRALRQRLIDEGFKRTTKFSWRDTALNTLSFMESRCMVKEIEK